MRLTLEARPRVGYYDNWWKYASAWGRDETGRLWWKHKGLNRWFSTLWEPTGPTSARNYFSASADCFAMRKPA